MTELLHRIKSSYTNTVKVVSKDLIASFVFIINILELGQFPVTARGRLGVREARALDFLLLLQRVVVRGW